MEESNMNILETEILNEAIRRAEKHDVLVSVIKALERVETLEEALEVLRTMLMEM